MESEVRRKESCHGVRTTYSIRNWQRAMSFSLQIQVGVIR